MMFDYNYWIYQTSACNLSHIEDWCQIIGLKNASLGNLKGKSMWLNHPFKLRYNLDIQSGFGSSFYQIMAVQLKSPCLTKKRISQVFAGWKFWRYVWNTSEFIQNPIIPNIVWSDKKNSSDPKLIHGDQIHKVQICSKKWCHNDFLTHHLLPHRAGGQDSSHPLQYLT